MGFYDYQTVLCGKRVVEYQRNQPLSDPDATVLALRVEYDAAETAVDILTELLQDPAADRLTGLVLGQWAGEMVDETPSEFLEALVAAAPRLPSMTALFLGDILQEEYEVSWIEQADVSPLWAAFPKLEYFAVRGSNGLRLGRIEHSNLTTLIIECGGLPVSVIRDVSQAKLPALEHLELYLGASNYGWDGTADDLRPILSGELFPKLKYLGLRNSEVADEVAAAVAAAPILQRTATLETLDLSLGNMTDAGAQALLASGLLGKLKKLDLHHHFISEEVAGQFEGLSIEVDLNDRQDEERYGDEVYRYIAVSE